MLTIALEKCTEWLSEILKNEEFLEKIQEVPAVFERINFVQELLLELHYRLKKVDYELLLRNLDIVDYENL
jgi:hypothetical protein